ncbi:unnamed protein product [marine sediment metagenome]|uniref:Uncharacterized protein n=1 Tax=marine sediment metagenome TaxID=412755 RepID=X1M906_9ZZZZ
MPESAEEGYTYLGESLGENHKGGKLNQVCAIYITYDKGGEKVGAENQYDGDNYSGSKDSEDHR